MSRPLRIAVPKGRMFDDALALWERIGSGIDDTARVSRRLIIPSIDGRFEFLPVKPQDVATYVEAGVADAGVVGWDVIEEHQPDVLHPLDLGFGRCRVVIAAPADHEYPTLPGGETPRVATKYVETARRFFAERGIQVRLIRIAGSVEVAPLLGLSHWILDLVESGRTLAENGLVVVDEVCDSTARLVVNRASHKLRVEEHQRLIAELERALAEMRGSPSARSAS
jgi:ATP phosphoribosyltransferase